MTLLSELQDASREKCITDLFDPGNFYDYLCKEILSNNIVPFIYKHKDTSDKASDHMFMCLARYLDATTNQVTFDYCVIYEDRDAPYITEPVASFGQSTMDTATLSKVGHLFRLSSCLETTPLFSEEYIEELIASPKKKPCGGTLQELLSVLQNKDLENAVLDQFTEAYAGPSDGDGHDYFKKVVRKLLSTDSARLVIEKLESRDKNH